MGRKYLFVAFLLLLMPLVLAQDYYKQVGFDYRSTNRHTSSMDLTNLGITTYNNLQPSNRFTGFDSFAPLTGDVNGDGITDVILYASDFNVYKWDNSSSLILQWDDLYPSGVQLPATRGSTAVLMDSDDDGDDEFYYCGRTVSPSVTYVAGYQWINNTPEEMWRVPIGSTDGSIAQCDFFTQSGFGTKNNTYYPKGAKINNTNYVFFIARQNQSAITTSGGRITVWQFNAQTGASRNFTLTEKGACGGGSVSPTSPTSTTAGGTRFDIYGFPVRTFNTITPAICESGPQSHPLLYIPVDCSQGAGVFHRGMYTVRADALTDQQYINIFTDTGTPMSSPSCLPSQGTTKERAVFVGGESGSGDMQIFFSEGTNIQSINTESLSITVNRVSDMFLGEFSDSSNLQYDDVCFFGQDTVVGKLATLCTDVDKVALLSNPDTVIAVENVAFAHGSDYKLFPYVHTTSGSFSSPATYSDVFFGGGFYKSAPDGALSTALSMQSDSIFSGEGLDYIPTSFGFSNGSCIMSDLNGNGFSDVLCSHATGIKLGISVSVPVPNQNPTYSVTEKNPVEGRCTTSSNCSVNNGTTITYNLSAIDPEQDSIQYAYDCDTRFAPGPTLLTSFTRSVNVTCTYTIIGPAITRFWVSDELIYENSKTIGVNTVYAQSGSFCNNNGIFEPHLGETALNCLGDFSQTQTPEEIQEEQDNAQAEQAREDFLQKSGIDLDGQLAVLTLDENGNLVEVGQASLIKNTVYKLLAYLLLFLSSLLVLVVLLGIIVRLSK
jgi:Fe-S cluster biogenesis protein NfuA